MRSGSNATLLSMSQENVLPGSELARLVTRRARECGGRPFLEDIHGGRALTYARLADLVRQRRTTLDAAAIPPSARVLIDVADPIEFSAAYLGVIAAGRCAVPVNPQAPVAELERTATAVRPAAIIGDWADRARCLGLPVLHAVPPSHAFPSSHRVPPSHSTPAGHGRDADARREPSPGSVLLLTSGSTGAPKTVELTEDRLLHVARAVARHNRLTPDDRGFSPLPLFHINAEVVALLATLTAGAVLLLDCRFHRQWFWEALAERDVTWINLVPAILTILAGYPVPVRPPRLRFVRSASAPLPVAVRHRIEALTGAPVVESYGMTEAASQITATPLDGSAPAGSCGRPVGAEVQVRDSDGRPVPPGTTGQIWIRGAGVIDAYAGGRGAGRFDAGGWLDTRDLGYLDEDGFLFLAGRSDDVINRGGEMMYPREIEEVLIADPAVRDAVVVGRPDPVLGQVPVAYVIPARDPATANSLQELLDLLSARCSAQLSRYKLPEAIYVVEDLPRAVTGKIQQRVLAREAVLARGGDPPEPPVSLLRCRPIHRPLAGPEARTRWAGNDRLSVACAGTGRYTGRSPGMEARTR
jgi:acyl-CoA synthetase (AMP-forming)/AMP-acid ligase II